MQFAEDIIPEYVVIGLSLIALVVCLLGAFKWKDLPSIGYIIPTTYLVLIFIGYAIFDPPLLVRQFFSRVGFCMFLVDIIIWRYVAWRCWKGRQP